MQKILVVGDLMIDSYIWGSCERISPEAPVGVVDVARRTSRLGGCGNVISNLVALGAQVGVISVLGCDEVGEQILRLLGEKGVPTGSILRQRGRVSSQKSRIIAAHQQVLRLDSESVGDIECAEEVERAFAAAVADYDIVLLSDYGKGVLTRGLTPRLIARARAAGKRVLADPKGADFSKYRGAFLLTPNKKEAALAVNFLRGADVSVANVVRDFLGRGGEFRITDDESLAAALRVLKHEFELDESIITLSEGGIARLGGAVLGGVLGGVLGAGGGLGVGENPLARARYNNVSQNGANSNLSGDLEANFGENFGTGGSNLRENLRGNDVGGGAEFVAGSVEIYPAIAKEVFDVTGAGDCVLATLGVCLARGDTLAAAIQTANFAAGVVVAKIGSADATWDEIEHLRRDFEAKNAPKNAAQNAIKNATAPAPNSNLGEEKLYLNQGQNYTQINQTKPRDFNSKILTQIPDFKSGDFAGKKVVFTNGCFDILHFGHVSYLQKARAFGDLLIVGLNSDDSVRTLKGPARPLNPQNDRAAVLAALECVDFVIIFDELTPQNLIAKIRPDVLVKGADYTGKKIVGSEIAGRVELVEFEAGRSTTSLIERAQKRAAPEPKQPPKNTFNDIGNF